MARLDHIADVGAQAVWLSPIYPSPMADFGYDVSDYCDVEPLFGTLADFDALVEAAHARGLRVVLDWVPNHTSDRHPWFEASRSGRSDPRRDWYVWRDPGPDGGPPNDWRSTFEACGPAWTFDAISGQYYLHSFMPQQPDLDWDNPEVEAAMHDVLRFWLERGVDGFRLDAIAKIAKDPLLRSHAGSARRHDEDWDTIHERLRRIRAVVDGYGDRMVVGEVALLDLHRVVSYLGTGDQLHLAHNFVFVHLPWDAEAFRTSIADFEALAEATAWPAWFLENHDVPRVASRFGPEAARAVLVLLHGLRGTPFLYQGQELGLPDAAVPPDRVVDVDGRDPERAPMPWAPGPGAGFTTGEPWLPLVEDADALCAARQREDPASALELTRRLARLRAATPALVTGDQLAVDLGPEVVAFERTDGADRWLVAVNFAADPVPLPAGEVAVASGPGRPGVLAGREAVLLRLS